MIDRSLWLSGRRKFIGSSDAAGIFGCGYSNQSAYSVWLSKVETDEVYREAVKVSDASAELMAEGANNEPLVIQAFRSRHPELEVFSDGFDLRTNEAYPNLCASLDAYAINDQGEEVPVEAKWILNPSRKIDGEWVNEWDDGKCPLKYQFQTFHQMIVIGASRGVVVAFVRGEYMERWIEWDQDVVDWMLSQYDAFWQHVENKTRPPEPKPIEMEVRDVETGTAVMVGSETSDKIKEILELQKKIGEWQSRKEVLLDSVARKIGSAQYAMLSDGTAVKLHQTSVKSVRRLPKGVKVVN